MLEGRAVTAWLYERKLVERQHYGTAFVLLRSAKDSPFTTIFNNFLQCVLQRKHNYISV